MTTQNITKVEVDLTKDAKAPEKKEGEGVTGGCCSARPRRTIRAIFLLNACGGLGPECRYDIRAKDGWTFEDDGWEIVATRTIKPGLPNSEPIEQCFGIGRSAIRYVDYAPRVK
jgi:hypothetical protein